MPKFMMGCEVTVVVFKEIEADSKEEAIDIYKNFGETVDIPNHCWSDVIWSEIQSTLHDNTDIADTAEVDTHSIEIMDEDDVIVYREM